MADLRAIYTWRTWTFAWLLRMLAQVSMFALLGKMLGSAARTQYLLVGNAVLVMAFAVLAICASTAWERMAGTLPLLIASPTAPFVVFAGRSVQWLLDGVGCSLVSLFLLAPLFGVRLPMPAALLVVPLVVLIAVSVYCFGLVLASIALRAMRLRSLIANTGSLSLMVLAGVQVSVSFWPAPVQYLANVLPLTHGLQAVREVLADGRLADIGRQAALECSVALGWLVLAGLAFRHLAESGRRDGSIEFGG
ncbi:ABC transporter permease [Catellatospora sichuanensis]|uniref:ABC transporter permease n=1 Tax=Catellatospora sichuanensis TaxID=1969805 RepID=UPI001642C14D|nr:ABC transporter permease [Catellatospora sichuanensis]